MLDFILQHNIKLLNETPTLLSVYVSVRARARAHVCVCVCARACVCVCVKTLI